MNGSCGLVSGTFLPHEVAGRFQARNDFQETIGERSSRMRSFLDRVTGALRPYTDRCRRWGLRECVSPERRRESVLVRSLEISVMSAECAARLRSKCHNSTRAPIPAKAPLRAPVRCSFRDSTPCSVEALSPVSRRPARRVTRRTRSLVRG